MGVLGTNYSQEQFSHLPLTQKLTIATDYAISGGAKIAQPGQTRVYDSLFTQEEFDKTPLPFQVLARAGYTAGLLTRWIAPNPRMVGNKIGSNLSAIFFPSAPNVTPQNAELEAIKQARLKQPDETDPTTSLKNLFPNNAFFSFAGDLERDNWKGEDIPNVSKFPEKIYADNPVRAAKTFQAPRPTIPGRRLAKLNPFSGSTKTPPRRTQTLKSSASSRVYGILLSRPMSSETAVMYQSKKSPFLEAIEGDQKKAAAKFAEWAGNSFEKYPDKFSLYDTGVILLTGIDADRTELYFGTDILTGLAQEFKRQSVGALNGVRCKVPTKIESKEPPQLPPLTKEPLKGLVLDNGNGNSALIQAIARTVGIAELPDTVPEWLIANTTGDIKINNLPQLMAYTIKQLDALAGQFPIELVIKDTDPTKPGDQTKKINLSNIGETLAEMAGMQINTLINSETLINICLRALTQAGSATIAATVAQDYAKANAEFLGWKEKVIARDIPFIFTPDKDTLEEILVESTQKIDSIENVDKQDLVDHLKQLLFAAAIIRAVHFRKINPEGDVKKQVRDQLAKFKDMLDPKNEDKEWDDFIRQVEIGFTDATGIDDTINPYGRPFDERPKVKDLNDTSI